MAKGWGGGSIAGSTLFRMGVGIGLVVVISGLIAYRQVYRSLERQAVEQLRVYAAERGQRESISFKRAERAHATLRDAFITRCRASAGFDLRPRFDRYFEPWADGTVRTRRMLFDGGSESGVWYNPGVTGFIGRGEALTPTAVRRLTVAYDLLNAHGPAWRDHIQNLYMSVGGNKGLIYWPGVPWDLDVPADTDLTGSEWHQSSAPERNPSRKPVWIGPYLDPVAGVWMVSCITPMDIDGVHLGHIGSDLTLSEMFRRMTENRLKDAYTFILSDGGHIIAHPELMDQIEAGMDVTEMNDPHLARIHAWARSAPPDGAVTLAPLNGEYLAVTRIRGPDWLLIMAFPRSSVTGPAIRSARMVLILGLLVLAGVIPWLFWVLSRQVAAPLRAFVASTGELAEGAFDATSRQGLPVARTDEIGDLARSFQHMDTRLRSAFAAIQARAEERARLVAAIEQSGEIIVITDTRGVIEYVNPAFEQITGYTSAEALGRTPRLVKSGCQDLGFYEDLWQTISAGRTWRGEMVNQRKDGTLYTEETIISPVRDGGGRIINYVGVKRDITDQLQMEAEKRELERRSNQLQRLESVGRLAGGVAHDLNNLLTPILGYAEMLLTETSDNAPRRANLKGIIAAAWRARDLVAQLLAFGRRQMLSLTPVDLNTVLRRFHSLLRRTLREDVELRIIPAPDLPLVRGDMGQLEQVIMNLAVNAQDAMPEGGTLTIETGETDLDETYAATHEEVTPGRHVVLSFSDTGFGMDDETRTHLFEPFFTTKEAGRGTGLGLATVFGIVKQHGGSIGVYSEPSAGTVVRVYLPVTDETESETAPSDRTEAAEVGGDETILLAEDNPEVRQSTRAILERLGYTVLEAASGEKALDQLDRHPGPLHLLLTDVVMPNMSGKALYSRIAGRYPDIRVLYMSGYTDNVIASRGVIDADVHFIQKPFSLRTLAAAVRRALTA